MNKEKIITGEYEQPKSKSVHSNCGVFGIYNHPQASVMTYYGLHALQHRGQEAAGIVTSEFLEDKNKYHFNVHKGFGLVLSVFSFDILTNLLKGTSAIGHNRYSTTGSANKRNNIQPFKVHYKDGNIALSHNGNLTNTSYLRNKLEHAGTIFQTTTDSEIILHLIARSKKNGTLNQLLDAFSQIKGAFSICIMTDDKLFAVRDPHGVRPLSMGILDNSIVFASESTSFDIINAEYIRDVEPGEMIMVDKEVKSVNDIKSYKIGEVPKYSHCIFEYIYFSRPDGIVFSERVDKVRRKIGRNLALEKPSPKKDNPDDRRVVIINVPDSSNTATLGYYNETLKFNQDVRLEIGLIRSHYIGRTFIEPGQDERKIRVKTKFNIVKGVLEGRKVVIVDDSIVRGNTSKLLVELIKKANPKEIHLKITSPPIISPCYYGMDFPSPDELIANQCNRNVSGIRDKLGVDELDYLSIEKLLESVPYPTPKTGYCTACFNCIYPIKPEEKPNCDKEQYED